MNCLDVRPPVRQNTFVVEDTNAMPLDNNVKGDKSRTNGSSGPAKKAVRIIPETAVNKTSSARIVITSKTDSGMGADGGFKGSLFVIPSNLCGLLVI